MKLNTAETQRALGVPVNNTALDSELVFDAFISTGDHARGMMKEHIAHLLDNGVKVHLGYGDRDVVCPWMGGELSSLDVSWSGAQSFAAAGYANLTLGDESNDFHGLTRQSGNFSFTRVFQGSHGWFNEQPRAAREWIMRALLNRDIATGTKNIADDPDYSTQGPSDTLWFREVADVTKVDDSELREFMLHDGLDFAEALLNRMDIL